MSLDEVKTEKKIEYDNNTRQFSLEAENNKETQGNNTFDGSKSKPSVDHKFVDKIAVISFYCFCNIENIDLIMPKLLWVAKRKGIKGTILLSKEGFNGSISGEEIHLNTIIDELIILSNAPRDQVSIKVNYCDKQPFSRIKIKLKDEIVALRAGAIDVNAKKGEYIDPSNWDDFISREDVILIDTRNDYEVEIGTFRGAINPFTDTFRDFTKWAEDNKTILKNKKIAMCCTGGIRCEKSTAYMKELGYEEVYHLKGGILQYLEDTANESGMWQGKCFVFDDRGAVDDHLKPADGHWMARRDSSCDH